MTAITKEAMERLHYNTAHAFKQRWFDQYGPCDGPARLLAIMSDGRKFEGLPGDRTGEAMNTVGIGSLIGLSIAGLILGEGPARLDRLIIAVEAFTQRAESDEQLPPLRRGDMTRDFRDNPDTKVTEAATTYMAQQNDDGEFVMWSAVQPYHYDDGGQLVWGEVWVIDPTDEGEGAGGDLYDQLANVFKHFGVKR